jgi:UDP-N-acetylglucosamine acyltransferase
VNRVGLERRGFSPEQLERVKRIHRLLYREGLNRTQALERLQADPDAATEEFRRMLEFAQASERGLARGARG